MFDGDGVKADPTLCVIVSKTNLPSLFSLSFDLSISFSLSSATTRTSTSTSNGSSSRSIKLKFSCQAAATTAHALSLSLSLCLSFSPSFSVFLLSKRHDEQEYTTENTNSLSWKIPILCSYYFFLSSIVLSSVLYCIVLYCTVLYSLYCCVMSGLCVPFSILFCLALFSQLFLILCQVKMFSLSVLRFLSLFSITLSSSSSSSSSSQSISLCLSNFRCIHNVLHSQQSTLSPASDSSVKIRRSWYINTHTHTHTHTHLYAHRRSILLYVFNSCLLDLDVSAAEKYR